MAHSATGTGRWAAIDRARVRRHWHWREEVCQQVVNTDIDGLLTAALLHDIKGWPVVGFYDTETLWLSEGAVTPLDLRTTLWVDVDMSWPGARSLSHGRPRLDRQGGCPRRDGEPERGGGVPRRQLRRLPLQVPLRHVSVGSLDRRPPQSSLHLRLRPDRARVDGGWRLHERESPLLAAELPELGDAHTPRVPDGSPRTSRHTPGAPTSRQPHKVLRGRPGCRGPGETFSTGWPRRMAGHRPSSTRRRRRQQRRPGGRRRRHCRLWLKAA